MSLLYLIYYGLAYIPPIIIMWHFLILLFPNLMRQFITKLVWEFLKAETFIKISYKNVLNKISSVIKRVSYNTSDKEENLYIFVKNGVEVAYLDFDDIIEETLPDYDFVWNMIDNNMVRINDIQTIFPIKDDKDGDKNNDDDVDGDDVVDDNENNDDDVDGDKNNDDDVDGDDVVDVDGDDVVDVDGDENDEDKDELDDEENDEVDDDFKSSVKFLSVNVNITLDNDEQKYTIKYPINLSNYNYYIVDNILFDKFFIKWYLRYYTNCTEDIYDIDDNFSVSIIDDNVKCLELKSTEYIVITADGYRVENNEKNS